jgi:hypothetical protein
MILLPMILGFKDINGCTFKKRKFQTSLIRRNFKSWWRVKNIFRGQKIRMNYQTKYQRIIWFLQKRIQPTPCTTNLSFITNIGFCTIYIYLKPDFKLVFTIMPKLVHQKTQLEENLPNMLTYHNSNCNYYHWKFKRRR